MKLALKGENDLKFDTGFCYLILSTYTTHYAWHETLGLVSLCCMQDHIGSFKTGAYCTMAPATEDAKDSLRIKPYVCSGLVSIFGWARS